jgi:hypothetical protein
MKLPTVPSLLPGNRHRPKFSHFASHIAAWLLTALLGMSATAQAALLLDQDFSTFNTGNLVGQGNWTQIGSAATPNLTIANGTIQLANSGQDAGVSFTSTNSGSLYLGLKLRITSANTAGDYFTFFNTSASGTSFTGRVFAKKGTGTNKFLLGLQMGATGATPTYGTAELDLNTDYVVILRYNFVSGTLNDTGAIYVSPADTAVEANNLPYTTSTWAGTSNEQAALAAASLRQGSANNAAAGTISKLMVTTDWLSLAALSTGVSIPVPTLSGISPEAALPGASITLTGTNLTSPTSVTFSTANGTEAATVSSSNATQIICTVPGNATSGSVTVTTADGDAAIAFRSLAPIATPYGPENFETSQGSWFTYSAAGSKNWAYVSSTLGAGSITGTTNKAMEMNGYGSDVAANDWMIIGPLDCSSITNPVVTFNALTRYTSAGLGEMEVKVSTDYSGAGDPSLANWTSLTFSKPAAELTKSASGQVLLTGAANQSEVYVAFHYTAGGTTSGTALWQIDDIEIYNMTTPALTVTAPGNLAEGATAAIGTVAIPAALESDLVVSLASADATEILLDGSGDGASANSTVTIYAGNTSAEFLIYAQTDNTVDGTQSVQITADAQNYDFGQAMVSVTDVDYPAPTIVINKTLNNGSSDVIELLVIGNGTVGSTLDLQGMILKDYSSNGASDGGGKITFATSSTWSALKAGTLVVLSLGNAATEDLDGADFLVRANLGNTALFTAEGGMDIGATEVVQIKATGSTTAGHTGAIHTFAFGSSSAAQVVAAPMPKLVGSASGSNQVATNASSSLADFSGTGITLLTSAPTFGVAHNAENAAFISSLRGVQGISITPDSSVQILPETAGEQLETITISLSTIPAEDVTVTLTASPSSAITWPATVVVPAGSSSTRVSFTPVDDTLVAGNREVTLTASADGYESGTSAITVVDAQFESPSVVINEVLNGGSNADSIELLVIQNSLNIVGMILKDFSGNMGGDSGGKFTFADTTLWRSLPAGTLVVLTTDQTATEDTDASDGTVTVLLSSNSTYFTGTGTFDFSNTDMATIKAAGTGTAGLSGAIHTFAVGTPGSFYNLATGAKLLAPAGTEVSAGNSNSALADYNGTDATTATATLGLANNAANEAFIQNLRTSVPPLISGTLSLSGTVGVPVANYQITASANATSYAASTLPDGLSLNTATGEISGTPAVATAGTVVAISATNAFGTGSANLTVTIAKGTPSITNAPAATNLNGSQTLSESTLSGGTASVPGAFAFTNGNEVPTISGNHSVTFTPSDTSNYELVTLNVFVTVIPPSSDFTFSDWSGGQELTPDLLKKFAIGGAASPAATAEEPLVAMDDSELSITAIVRTNNSQLAIAAEATTNLASAWSPTDVTTSTEGISQADVPAGSERRKFSVPVSGTKRFLRLKITLAQ